MSKSESILENGRIAQKELNEVVNMALYSLKSLMADYETPIELRLKISFRLFEIFGFKEKNTPDKDAIVDRLEKNRDGIEGNARRLSNLRSLLEELTQPKQEKITNQLEASRFAKKINRKNYQSIT